MYCFPIDGLLLLDKGDLADRGRGTIKIHTDGSSPAERKRARNDFPIQLCSVAGTTSNVDYLVSGGKEARYSVGIDRSCKGHIASSTKTMRLTRRATIYKEKDPLVGRAVG